MFSKRLGLLVVLAISSAFGQVPDGTNVPLLMPAVAQGATLGPDGLPIAGATNNQSWAGYAVTGNNFHYVKGSWIVPGSHCLKTPEATSFFGVGLDAWPSSTATTWEVIGTMSNCVGTTPQYFAYAEFYPVVAGGITSFPVKAGDVMSAEVSYIGASKFTATIKNETTGKSFSKTVVVPGAHRASAEWIATPTGLSGSLGLENFGTVSSGYDFTNIKNTNYASDSAVTGPISDFGGRVVKITMVDSSSKKLAVPSALSTDGSSFSVAWKAEK